MVRFRSAALFMGAIATVAVFRYLPANESRVESTTDSTNPSSSDDGQFIMHEWGTFTTFSGSDGVFIDYRPLAQAHADLPRFVWNRGTASNNGIPIFAKSRVFARVRMETPVTYFYTDRVRSIDVKVDFPKGLLTEFYPPARTMLPAFDSKQAYGAGEAIGDSSLDWGNVELIPTDSLLPNVLDKEMRAELTDDLLTHLLPSSAMNDHYGAARETDSALVRVKMDAAQPQQPTWFPNPPPNSHYEKFLFYRGVGKFQLPYNATYDSDTVAMTNTGDISMNSAILIDADEGNIRASTIDRLGASEATAFPATKPITEEGLAELVQQTLVAEGLFEKEATAMVSTWRKSWFTENGTRILYVVPQELTDELIPLHISPAPQQSLRVLVGRMEVMSLSDEQQMMAAVAESAKQRRAFLAVKDRDKRIPFEIPKAILRLGRMTEPALIRVSKIAKDDEVRKEAENLIRQCVSMKQTTK